jgi:hypothetical protein
MPYERRPVFSHTGLPGPKKFFSSTSTLIELTDTYYVLLSEVDIDKEISAGTA